MQGLQLATLTAEQQVSIEAYWARVTRKTLRGRREETEAARQEEIAFAGSLLCSGNWTISRPCS
jgi:hypothetical protein